MYPETLAHGTLMVQQHGFSYVTVLLYSYKEAINIVAHQATLQQQFSAIVFTKLRNSIRGLSLTYCTCNAILTDLNNQGT